MRKILIVDDNVDQRLAMSIILNDKGYWTKTCGTVKESLESLNGGHQLPDLVITDYYLPCGTTGVDLVRAMRAIPGGELIPCIMCTAAPTDRMTSIEQELGSLNVLVVRKPYNVGNFISVVEHLMGISHTSALQRGV